MIERIEDEGNVRKPGLFSVGIEVEDVGGAPHGFESQEGHAQPWPFLPWREGNSPPQRPQR